MSRTQAEARERILSVADELFYRKGVRAIGVETIVAQSEVAKTTLYRYFACFLGKLEAEPPDLRSQAEPGNE
jgi:AcrR family transcriptional regulator